MDTYIMAFGLHVHLNKTFVLRFLLNMCIMSSSSFLQQRSNDYGIPVAVEVTYVQDNFLTSDVLNEMVMLL